MHMLFCCFFHEAAHIIYSTANLLLVSGIIESDDIQIITAEVDKCLNFSKKCQMLIDNVKKKYYRQRFVSRIMLLLDICLATMPIYGKNH